MKGNELSTSVSNKHKQKVYDYLSMFNNGELVKVFIEHPTKGYSYRGAIIESIHKAVSLEKDIPSKLTIYVRVPVAYKDLNSKKPFKLKAELKTIPVDRIFMIEKFRKNKKV